MAKGCRFDVVQKGGQFPRGFENLPFVGGHRAALRIGGGCGYSDPKVMARLPEYVVEAFADVPAGTVIVSGGTMKVKELFDEGAQRTIYVTDGFMITLIPALLKGRYEGIVAASTTPRTEQMYLDANYGSLIVAGEYHLDYRQDHAIVFQQDALEIDPDDVDWVADVLPFLKIQRAWKEKGVKCAWLGFEGGGGTYKEAKWSLEHGIPCIFTEGSGRKSDDLVREFRAGKLLVRNASTGEDEPVDPALVTVVPFLDTDALNQALRDRGIIPAKETPAKAAGADTATTAEAADTAEAAAGDATAGQESVAPTTGGAAATEKVKAQ